MRFSTLRIAWRNLGRHRRRTLLCLAAIAIGQFAFITMSGVQHGMADAIRRVVTGPLIGHVQVHAPEWRDQRAPDLVIQDLTRTLSRVRACDGVECATARVYAPVLAALGETGFRALVIGVDVAAESRPRLLLAGLAADALPGDGTVAVGYLLARKLRVSGGEQIAVVGRAADGSTASALFTVRAIVKTPLDVVNRLGVLASLGDAQELCAMTDQAHEIVVYADDPDAADALASRLADLPGLAETEVLLWRDVAPHLAAYTDILDGAGLFVLGLLLLGSAAGIANTMMMSTFERTQEFGMLLSLGCAPRMITRMVVLEAVVLGLAGVIVGTAAGAGLVAALGRTGMNFALGGGSLEGLTIFSVEFPTRVHPRLALGDAAIGVFTVCVTAILTSLWPATRAARLEPAVAMRTR
jgi:ABC-type lipoprotein release transport system permease subunit